MGHGDKLNSAMLMPKGPPAMPAASAAARARPPPMPQVGSQRMRPNLRLSDMGLTVPGQTGGAPKRPGGRPNLKLGMMPGAPAPTSAFGTFSEIVYVALL